MTTSHHNLPRCEREHPGSGTANNGSNGYYLRHLIEFLVGKELPEPDIAAEPNTTPSPIQNGETSPPRRVENSEPSCKNRRQDPFPQRELVIRSGGLA
jgi:hypothetical protein